MGLFLPRCRTLHLLTLNSVTQISARLEVFKVLKLLKKCVFPAFRNLKE